MVGNGILGPWPLGPAPTLQQHARMAEHARNESARGAAIRRDDLRKRADRAVAAETDRKKLQIRADEQRELDSIRVEREDWGEQARYRKKKARERAGYRKAPSDLHCARCGSEPVQYSRSYGCKCAQMDTRCYRDLEEIQHYWRGHMAKVRKDVRRETMRMAISADPVEFILNLLEEVPAIYDTIEGVATNSAEKVAQLEGWARGQFVRAKYDRARMDNELRYEIYRQTRR